MCFLFYTCSSAVGLWIVICRAKQVSRLCNNDLVALVKGSSGCFLKYKRQV